MPQGLSGALVALMEETVGDMNLVEVPVYLDDVIIFGQTLEEHEEQAIWKSFEAFLWREVEVISWKVPILSVMGHLP